jgi:predicted O-methyltransferase YrrM
VDKPKETCHHGIPGRNFETFACNEESYIHEHLPTLYFIALEFNCQNVLEIGTGDGDSTIALAEAMQATGGIVTTLDIETKGTTIDKINDHGVGHHVNFIQEKSMQLVIDGFFDLILIDGDHNKEAVQAEIAKYIYMLQDGGFIIFHDTNNPAWKGVREAVQNFITHPKFRDMRLRIYEWFNCNGLTVIRKPE